MAGGKHILGKQSAQRIFGTAKVGDRGQIVIPKEAREFFGIKPGDTLLILGKNETGLIVTRPETLHELADRIFYAMDNEEQNHEWAFPKRSTVSEKLRWSS